MFLLHKSTSVPKIALAIDLKFALVWTIKIALEIDLTVELLFLNAKRSFALNS